jgi:hypothetical protein
MLQAAMDAGASGATISTCRSFSVQKDQNTTSQKAVEISDMVVGANQKKNIISAVMEKGFFGKEINGRIIVKKSNLAFSYVGKKK